MILVRKIALSLLVGIDDVLQVDTAGDLLLQYW